MTRLLCLYCGRPLDPHATFTCRRCTGSVRSAACWWDHSSSSAVRVDNCATPRRGRECPEIEECDGTEECPDCGGTGLVDLDAEWAEARKILRGSEG